MRILLLLVMGLILLPASAGEFPLKGTEQRVGGELVEAEFVHRTGVFRTDGTGELVSFTLSPFAVLNYLTTEADLREVPLGTHLTWSLLPDADGKLTQVVMAEADHGIADPAATEALRKHHAVLLKDRGLPAFIDKVEGKKLKITLIGDAASHAAFCKDEGLDWAQVAKEHRTIGTAVANEELRSYNPPVDQKQSTVQEYRVMPTDRFGCAGVQLVIEPNILLEGFRKDHFIRIFKDSWPVKDMPFGESIYPEIFNAETVETDPYHYSFRTDFANPHLPWYRLKPGEFPPMYSAHEVGGELVNVDVLKRSGQFKMDRTGELINFTMPPFGGVQRYFAEGDLGDLALGERYSFSMHPDAQGTFTKATLIMDEFSHLLTYRTSYRLDEIKLDAGKLYVAKQLPPMKDERDAMIQPPDLGRKELLVDDHTRVWKGDQQIKLTDLAAGDQLIFNRTARTPTSQGRCMDLWVGRDTHQRAAEQQHATNYTLRHTQGHPAWIEHIEGKQITVTFFDAKRTEFAEATREDPKGKTIQTLLINDQLQPLDETKLTMKVLTRLPETTVSGVYGSSRVRWLLEPEGEVPQGYHQGQCLRVIEQK